MILGLRTVKSIVLSFAVSMCVKREFDMKHGADCWRRVITNAMTSRRLAHYQKVDPQEAFLAGLLQEFGILFFATARPKQYDSILDECEQDVHELKLLEQREFHADHATLGGYVLEKWKMPNVLVNAVKNHHECDHLAQLQQRPEPSLANLMAMSEIVSDLLSFPNERNLDRFDQLISILGPQGSDCDKFLQELDLQVREISVLFDIKLPDVERYDEMVQRARAEVASMPDPIQAEDCLLLSRVDQCFSEIRKEQKPSLVLIASIPINGSPRPEREHLLDELRGKLESDQALLSLPDDRILFLASVPPGGIEALFQTFHSYVVQAAPSNSIGMFRSGGVVVMPTCSQLPEIIISGAHANLALTNPKQPHVLTIAN